MEKMTLIKSQVISIPHQLQRGLPGIFSVKQVTKVFCGLLKIFRIGRSNGDGFASRRIHEGHYSLNSYKKI
jgi:hypothetical protein